MDQGLEAIIKFMSRLETEGKETCNLAMLAILGKGEVHRPRLTTCPHYALSLCIIRRHVQSLHVTSISL